MSFDVKMPDGTIIQDVPDGTTKEQVMQKFARHKKVPKAELPGFFKRLLIGAGRGFTDVGEGLQQFFMTPGMGMGGAQVPTEILQKQKAAQEAFTQQAQAGRLEFEQTPVGQSQTSTFFGLIPTSAASVGRFIGNVAPFVVAPAAGATLPAKMAIGAATGGGIGGTSFVPEGGSRGRNIALGTALGGLIPPVLRAPVALIGAGKEIIRPFTQKGMETIGGRTLRRLATDPKKAMRRMRRAPERVPGSAPTAAEAARDVGLLTAEAGIRSTSPRFKIADASRNAARKALLDTVAKTKGAVDDAIKARDDAAIPLIEKARASGAKVDAKPIVDKIDEILASGAAKQTPVKTAMLSVKKALHNSKGGLETSVDSVYGVRRHIGDLMSGKLKGARSDARFAKKELIKIQELLDNQVGKVSPEFKPFLKIYSGKSTPIDRLKALQGVRDKTLTSGVDVTGENLLSQAKWTTVVTKALPELRKTLTPQQTKVLHRIGKDLDSAARVNAAGKSIGSNTFKNFTTANLLGTMFKGRGLSNPIVATLMRPLNFIFKVNDEQMMNIMVDAMLDPKMARTLMMKATPKTSSEFAKFVKDSLSGIAPRAAAVQSTREK